MIKMKNRGKKMFFCIFLKTNTEIWRVRKIKTNAFGFLVKITNRSTSEEKQNTFNNVPSSWYRKWRYCCENLAYSDDRR